MQGLSFLLVLPFLLCLQQASCLLLIFMRIVVVVVADVVNDYIMAIMVMLGC